MLHYPVLLKEAIELLNIKPDGTYVDGTFGRGGHARAILKKLSINGRLIAFDRDLEAVSYAKKCVDDKRMTIIHDNFVNIDKELEKLGIKKVDGILLDLGVSSPQLDEPKRGFSFSLDAKLDMRMDTTCSESAYEWINRVDEGRLADILWRYGEEKFSRRIAKNIVKLRNLKLIETTKELAKIIAASMPYKNNYDKHPATRSFQAIRIFINNELGNLEEALKIMPLLLNVGARIVVISFHSLEDRIVKTAFNNIAATNKLPKWVTVENTASEYSVVARKIKADINEIKQNVRSRSAIMRSLEKVR